MSDQDQTSKNLKIAYEGEAKACVRLLAYAERAEEEGYPQMAHLFRAISSAETVHALRSLRLLDQVKSTEENLKASFEQEMAVSENYYPEFLRTAEAEGNDMAVLGFSQARDAEEFHAKLYKNAIDHMIDEKATTYHVCKICGYVADGQVPEECPVCGAPPEQFSEVA